MIDAMERLDVRLLGRFEVSVDDQPVPNAAWTHARARDLVKLLALAPGHRMPRDRVLEELWPQLGVDAAVAKLHKAERDTHLHTFNFHGTSSELLEDVQRATIVGEPPASLASRSAC
jgi:hypothetical protein